MKKNYLLYLLMFISTNLIAQEDKMNINKNFELSGQLLITSKLQIEKNYASQPSDFSSALATAVKINLYRHAVLSKSWYYQMGVFGGVYAYRQKVRTQEDFVALGYTTDVDLRSTIPSSRFVGLNLGLNYQLRTEEHKILWLGIGINTYYFPITSVSSGLQARAENGISKRLFTSSIDTGEQNKIIIAPELNISYVVKLINRINLKISGNYAFSNMKIFEGEYKLHGDQEILTGKHSQKLRHFGISVGVLYQPKDSK